MNSSKMNLRLLITCLTVSAALSAQEPQLLKSVNDRSQRGYRPTGHWMSSQAADRLLKGRRALRRPDNDAAQST
jgi:hypothetical protein